METELNLLIDTPILPLFSHPISTIQYTYIYAVVRNRFLLVVWFVCCWGNILVVGDCVDWQQMHHNSRDQACLFCLSVCLFVFGQLCLFIYFVCLFICLFVCLFVCGREIFRLLQQMHHNSRDQLCFMFCLFCLLVCLFVVGEYWDYALAEDAS